MYLSKRMHGAYKRHSRGISAAVGRNQFGDGLPLVLRLVREQSYTEEHPDIYPVEPTVVPATEGPMNGAEIRMLTRNAWAICQLEIFYSRK